ncbi:hypothetical protein FA15DRAFT_695357 [Coprinopsis marcescibilis]|uniref:Uncharacterized protein n=1 Tax=Coprinopsis marcescibilis TaxID=230819 RepID=A0A5C3KS04_COPMA|nr:hypothetical protein FA15DRAFT_695357 [Coprinopsis marcescibilis]
MPTLSSTPSSQISATSVIRTVSPARMTVTCRWVDSPQECLNGGGGLGSGGAPLGSTSFTRNPGPPVGLIVGVVVGIILLGILGFLVKLLVFRYAIKATRDVVIDARRDFRAQEVVYGVQSQQGYYGGQNGYDTSNSEWRMPSPMPVTYQSGPGQQNVPVTWSGPPYPSKG